MSSIIVLAKLTAQEGKRADLVAGFAPMLEHVESEDGTLQYELCEDASDENVLWVSERYTDQAALDAHSSSDAMKAVGAALGPLLAAPPQLMFLTPVGGKGR
jgi:quinol monooxygenase YgiN